MDDTKYWLWLTMIFGTGSSRLWQAMNVFDSAKTAYYELSSGAHGLKLKDNEIRNINSTSLDDAVKYITECEKKGIHIAGCGSREYPPQLRHIMSPPAVLYYKGNISCLRSRTITAVGTRHASDYGLEAARRICTELAMDGIVIVSGFACGTDITSHLAAADSGRPTACVLGCGIDVDYPRENIGYRERILENGGVFISEYQPGTRPFSSNFPKRNRILAALGYAAVIFEASLKSGSLITANLTAEQGRDVFVLPPADIFGSRFSGNIQLLKEGAQLLLDSRSVLDCFRIGGAVDGEIRSEQSVQISGFGVKPLASQVQTPVEKALSDKSERKPKKSAPMREKTRDTAPEPTAAKASDRTAPAEEAYADLTEIERKICGLLADGELHADMIAQRLEIDASELMVELTELELIGVIRSKPGKIFELIRG